MEDLGRRDAVGDRMVDADDERGAAVSASSSDEQLPEGTFSRQALAHELTAPPFQLALCQRRFEADVVVKVRFP